MIRMHPVMASAALLFLALWAAGAIGTFALGLRDAIRRGHIPPE
jgi:hypothetical protein